MTVGTIMTRKILIIDENASLKDAIAKIREEKTGSIMICRNGEPVGIFTERDFLYRYDLSKISSDEMLSDYSTENPICVEEGEDIERVFEIIQGKNIRHLPVVRNKKAVGIVSIKDLLFVRNRRLELFLKDREKELLEKEKLFEKTQSDREKELLEENERLSREVVIDKLTGIFNFNYFKARFTEEVNRSVRYEHPLSLLFLDIDHFKKVNDTFGHENGNVILVDIAKLISGEVASFDQAFHLRKSDIVARYGGEEFVVILVETPKEGALIIAEKIRRNVESHQFSLKNTQQTIGVTVSIGLASLFEDGDTADSLIVRADEAVYKAKHTGRNRVSMSEGLKYSGVVDDTFDDRSLVEDCIRKELLYLVYQPIVREDHTHIFGYEVLVRSKHPAIAGPGDLFTIAEKTGTVRNISRAIINLVTEQMVRIKPDRKVFINLHPSDFSDIDFIRSIAQDEKYHQYSNQWVFELTERAAITNLEAFNECVKVLKAAGFQIAVDDLGGGFSGLNSVVLLEPAFIKLDLPLIRNIHEIKIKQNIVESIIHFSRNQKDCMVIAEGIEAVEESEYLKSLGCDLMQGYFFGRPKVDIE